MDDLRAGDDNVLGDDNHEGAAPLLPRGVVGVAQEDEDVEEVVAAVDDNPGGDNEDVVNGGDEDDADPPQERRGFREAVELLRDVNDPSPIDMITVNWAGATVAARANDARSFPQFVQLLEEGGRAARCILIHGNVDWRVLPDNDMEALFGRVLPHHRTLTEIQMFICTLPIKFLRMLTTAIPAAPTPSPPKRLLFTRSFMEAFDLEKGTAIVDMLKRNANVEHVGMSLRLQTEPFSIVCQSLPRHTRLRHLSISVENAAADALDKLAASSLKSLSIWGSVSDDFVTTCARQLRTNETLQVLSLPIVNGRDDAQALLELVGTYNCTIRRVLELSNDPQFQSHMVRNDRIRRGLRVLSGPYRPEVLPTERLPKLLDLMRGVPTALYRLLKMGVGNKISDLIKPQVVTAAAIEVTGNPPRGAGVIANGDNDSST